MKRSSKLGLLLACMVCLAAGCAGKKQEVTDAISGASQNYYEASSFDQKRLWEAIEGREGSCTIATVNADGTPNLIVAVPAVAGDSHIYFHWADNVTKENARRTGKAAACYYLYAPDEEDKLLRNQGARLCLELETDETVIGKLSRETPQAAEATIFRVVQLLPLG